MSSNQLTLTPMLFGEAKALARRLLGCFPSASPPDLEAYLTELVTLLCGYPRWAGERALHSVKGAFLPSIPEVKMHLEDQVRVRRAAAAWDAGAKALLTGPDLSSPEYRDRMLGKFEGLAGDLRMQSAAQAAAEVAWKARNA